MVSEKCSEENNSKASGRVTLEAKKTLRARESLEIQSTFIRRVLAAAYGVNAVYFFRNVNYLNTVTFDAVDIICACRPQVRRIAVMHLILQNCKQLPRPMIIKLFDTINEYNNSRQREDQRPRWGLHMTEAHVMAIADTPVPPDLVLETAATAKAKAKAKPASKPPQRPSATPSSRYTSSTSSVRPPEPARGPKQPPTPPPGRGGKDHGKGSGGYAHRGGDRNYTGYGHRR